MYIPHSHFEITMKTLEKLGLLKEAEEVSRLRDLHKASLEEEAKNASLVLNDRRCNPAAACRLIRAITGFRLEESFQLVKQLSRSEEYVISLDGSHSNEKLATVAKELEECGVSLKF